jgi:hypothetical protein
MGLSFGLGDFKISGYIFSRVKDDKKSSSGYVFLFGGTIVYWLSKKQNYYFAKSTMKASIYHAAQW